MKHGTNKEKLSREIIALLLKIARKDGDFDEKEFAFILQVAATMDITPEELRNIHLNLDIYSFTPPSNEEERMTVLYYLLFCMKIDNKVNEEEVRLVQRMGFKLGFRQQLTDDLIRSVKQHAEQKLPEDELIKNLKKYMN